MRSLLFAGKNRVVDNVRQHSKLVATWSSSRMIEECSSLGYRIACGQRSDRLLFRILGLVDAAIQRSCGLQVYDQQLQAAYHLCHGRLVEMKTGEGKTLTAIFATIVFAMHRQGCHVVTANSYLAERDSNFVGSVFQQLGLTVE